MAKIFLVDDDRNLADLTRVALVKNGYDVVVFHEAKTVIDAVQRQKPNLILMDVMMPGLGGGEAVKIIRAHAGLTNVPVVFFTALVSGSAADAGIIVDGQKYRTFGKPYDIEALLQLVEETLR